MNIGWPDQNLECPTGFGTIGMFYVSLRLGRFAAAMAGAVSRCDGPHTTTVAEIEIIQLILWERVGSTADYWKCRGGMG